jgi:hypothetical protein
MPRFALIKSRRIIGILNAENAQDIPLQSGQTLLELTPDEGEKLAHSPHLLIDVLVSKDGQSLTYPSELISQEKQSKQDGGKMRRTTDLKSADVVFDGKSCFLQANVESAKLSIVSADGVPVLTFMVDSPFAVEFPEQAELFCLSNNVTTFYVQGWD